MDWDVVCGGMRCAMGWGWDAVCGGMRGWDGVCDGMWIGMGCVMGCGV